MLPKTNADLVICILILLQTMKRLNRAGVTMTRETYRSIMDDIGSDLTGR